MALNIHMQEYVKLGIADLSYSIRLFWVNAAETLLAQSKQHPSPANGKNKVPKNTTSHFLQNSHGEVSLCLEFMHQGAPQDSNKEKGRPIKRYSFRKSIFRRTDFWIVI